MREVWGGLSVVIALLASLPLAQASPPSSAPAAVLHTIEVTAQAQALTSTDIETAREEVRLTPGGVTLVSGEMLDQRNISSMSDMLRYVPGLYIVSDSGGSEIFFSSRGSNLDAVDYDMNGILLLQNGIPITAADGTNHNRVLNPLSAQYAIVARGANGMKYGASTLGGAINFISPTAYDLPSLVARVSMGSHGQVLGRITASQVFGNSLDALVTVESSHRDGFREHTEEDATSVYANAGWRISDSLGTRLYATYIDSDLELAGTLTRDQLDADYDQASEKALAGDFQRNVETWRVASKTTWQIGPQQRLDFGLAYEKQQLYHPIVCNRPSLQPPSCGGFSLLIDTDLETVAATLRYEQRLGSHDLLFGTTYLSSEDEGNNFFNNHGQPAAFQSRVHEKADTLTTYLVDRWHIAEHWTLIPGVQYVDASRTKKVAGANGDYSSVNPKLGVIYDIRPKVQIYGSVSRIFEPPTNFILADATTAANDTVEAMQGTVVEIGTRGSSRLGQTSHWHWDLSLYQAWLEDEILTVEDLTPACPRASCRFPSSNADDTIHTGLEALVGAHVTLDENGNHAIEPTISVAWNDFRFDDDPSWGDNTLPAAPDYTIRAEILYLNSSGYYVGPTVTAAGERYADYANSYTVDSYALLGILAGWSSDRWSVYVEVENLLDEEYVSTHSVVANAGPRAAILRPGPPLSLFMGARLALF